MFIEVLQDKTSSIRESLVFDSHGPPGFILRDARTDYMDSVHSSAGLYNRELASLSSIPLVQGPGTIVQALTPFVFMEETSFGEFTVAPFPYKGPNTAATLRIYETLRVFMKYLSSALCNSAASLGRSFESF